MQPPKAKKLPSGSWMCRVRVKGKDICITRDTEEEAVTEAMAVKYGLKQPDAPRKSATLAAAIDHYIETYRHTLSASTIRGYQYIRNNRFQSMMPLSMVHISREQWQTAIDREKRQVAPKTVRNAWGLITAVLTDAGLQIPAVKLPAQIKNAHEFLTADQIPVFLEALKGTKVEIPALLGLHSLRRSEILDLTWNDIDLRKQIIHVRGAAVYDDEHRLVHQPTNKNASSRRDVPIMIDRLSELLATAPRQENYVVNCNPNTIWAQVNKVCDTADLPRIGAHGLRHCFASLAKHIGMPEETAMLIGGWSDYVTMHKIYTHIAEKDVASKVLAMKNFYNQNTASE